MGARRPSRPHGAPRTRRDEEELCKLARRAEGGGVAEQRAVARRRRACTPVVRVWEGLLSGQHPQAWHTRRLGSASAATGS